MTTWYALLLIKTSRAGLKLESGVDKNGNGVLSDAEVLATNYVCNGQNGLNGLDGLDGIDGVNGVASLVRTSIELAGAHCLVGGLKLESGLDANGNGVLSDAEILATSFLCNGKNGLNGSDGIDGLASLVRTSLELAGAHCLVGGLKLESGVDANRNGVLNDGEVVATDYVCSGKDGLNGLNGLDGVDGIDGIDGPTGANGLASLVRTSLELSGSHCLIGGLKLESGLDANKNGVLNDAEVLATNYVCNGENGLDGLDGINGQNGSNGLNGLGMLVKQALELPGSNCVTGGLKLDTGVDANRNGTLDASEVTKTDYICNGLNGLNGLNGTSGTNGANSLIKTVIEPIGPNCHVSGLKVNSGPDTNGNGVLDTAEITGVSYLCL